MAGEKRRAVFTHAHRVVIKVGSGVITHERGLDLGVINRLCDEISLLREQGRQVVIVSSGAVASGMHKVGLKEWPRTIPQKQAAAAVGQSSLIQAYEEAFSHYGLHVAQILLTSDDLTHRRRYLNARHTFQTLLDWGIIPVVNENDTVVVEEIKFGDNDNLSALIAQLVEADLLVILTDTDGLYDCDPRHHPEARIISLVERIDQKIEACAGHKPGTFGTGGMASKVLAAKKATTAGIPVAIANGKNRYVIKTLFDAEPLGTLFLPTPHRLSARKRWIAHTLKPRGSLVVDAGAARAIEKQGKSLLASGIIQVVGKFDVGAPVRLLAADGHQLGTGLVNYSSSEIQQLMGRRSSEIEKILGYKHSDEVIHRDNFVLESSPPE